MLVGESVELRQLEHLTGPGAPLLLVALDLARPEEEVEQSLAGIVLRREDEVLQDGQVTELVRNLPRLGEPEVHDLVWRQAIDPDAVKPNLAAIGSIEPGDDVEQRGLPGPVRADEARDRFGEDRQAAAVDGLDSAECLFHGIDPKNRSGIHP